MGELRGRSWSLGREGGVRGKIFLLVERERLKRGPSTPIELIEEVMILAI